MAAVMQQQQQQYEGMRESQESEETRANNLSLLQAQRARRAAQEDAQRLANRLAQLQKEESKSERRIEETRSRAQEIRALRKRNEEKVAMRVLAEREMDEKLMSLRTDFDEKRKEHVRRKEMTAATLLAMKRQAMLETKVERAQTEREVAEMKLAARREAHASKEAVRESTLRKREKWTEDKMRHLRAVRTNYESRLLEEIAAVQTTEKELAKMAKMEMDLIAQLQRKQAEQREAYLELEQALGLSPSTDGGVRSTAELESAMAAMYRQQGESAPAVAGEPGEDEVAAAFSRFDAEGAGSIPTASLEGLMLALRMRLSAPQLAQARAQLDREGAGAISYGEFLLWWRG